MAPMSQNCGHCGFSGGIQHRGNVTATTQTDDHPDYGEISWSRVWSLEYCPNCEQPTVQEYFWSDEMSDPEDVAMRTLFPTRSDDSSLPLSVKRQMDIALKVKMVEPSFYAVGVRRVL